MNFDKARVDEDEEVSVVIDDDVLSNARLRCYNVGQTAVDDDNKKVPVNPKKFPDKAIVIKFEANGHEVEIWLDTEAKQWMSSIDGEHRLSLQQFGNFFGTQFFQKLVDVLKAKWPLSDEMYGELFDAVQQKTVSSDQPTEDIKTEAGEFQDDQIRKAQEQKLKLKKREKEKEAKAKYTNSGRKIVTFSDFGVNNNSFKGYCWPTPGKEFRWSQWKDWKKIRPLCRMSFKHNEYNYGVSISLFDENFENRGFRGYNLDIEPPLAWITPGECEQVMELTLFQKFAKHCVARIQKYIEIPTDEILEKINAPDKIEASDIDKTKSIIRKVLKYAIKPRKADTFSWR